MATPITWRRVAAFIGGAALFVASACSNTPDPGEGPQTGTAAGGTSDTDGVAEAGGEVGSSGQTVSFSTSAPPSYILPFLTQQTNSSTNQWSFNTLMYVPLLIKTDTFDEEASLAEEPTFSDDNKTVTLKLRDYQWSDGEPVTSRDVEFFFNLVKYNKKEWSHYLPGEFPDNVTSLESPDDKTVVLTLDKAYNPDWFVDTQLVAYTYAFPQHAWDKTSADGEIGDHDRTESGAQQVYKFLSGAAEDTSTYQTNPLWQVVNGPWKLADFKQNGEVTFVPNPNFSGQKATISSFVVRPYTTDAAKLNALLAGDLDVGQIPPENISQVARLADYDLQSFSQYQISFILLNFKNPTTGPLVSQLYIRQALAHLIDQPGQVGAYLAGGEAGFPVYGPVPPKAPGQFQDLAQTEPVYEFSVDKAKELLTSHGWEVPDGGPATCAEPGEGEDQCGADIEAGQKLEFNATYTSGKPYLEGIMTAFKSSASEAGIVVNLSAAPFPTAITELTGCLTDDPCTDDSFNMGTWATSFSWNYGQEFPTASAIQLNTNYSDEKFTELADAMKTAPDATEAVKAYNDYVAENLPMVFIPSVYTLNMVNKKLHNVEFYPNGFIAPNRWTVG